MSDEGTSQPERILDLELQVVLLRGYVEKMTESLDSMEKWLDASEDD